MYRKIQGKYTLIITLMHIQSSSCEQNFMLPAYRQRFAEVSHKDEKG